MVLPLRRLRVADTRLVLVEVAEIFSVSIRVAPRVRVPLRNQASNDYGQETKAHLPPGEGGRRPGDGFSGPEHPSPVASRHPLPGGEGSDLSWRVFEAALRSNDREAVARVLSAIPGRYQD